jgi:hypothetical protein
MFVLRMKLDRGFLLVGGVILFWAIFQSSRIAAAAQVSANRWSPRQRIPGIQDEADTPYLVADRNQTVHAFHSMLIEEDSPELAIVYSNWNLDLGWTLPVDILLPFGGDLAYMQGAFLDQSGMMHIIFYCCDDFSPNIYYSRAPAHEADRASAWSVPELIGEKASSPHTATLVGDNRGNLFVLYGGNLDGKGIYAFHSPDSGDTWSLPVPVFLTDDSTLLPIGIQAHVDHQGRLHAVWVVNNPSGTGDAIYYAGLEADRETWRDPVVFAEINQSDFRVGLISRVGNPAIAAYNQELIAIYMVCSPCEKRMRRSIDGGKTWTVPQDPFQTSRGMYGPVDFVIDSNDTLHVIFGDRARGQTMYHSVWRDGHWLELELVVPLSELKYPRGSPMAFTPTNPNAVISQGNVILISWRLDPGQGDNGTWYSYKELDTPELPLVPLPTVSAISAITPMPNITPVLPFSTPSPTPMTFSEEYGSPSFSNNPTDPLILGVLPVVLVIAGLIVGLQLFHHHRY